MAINNLNLFFSNFKHLSFHYQKIRRFSDGTKNLKVGLNADINKKTVLVEKVNKVFKITLNRPTKFNAMTLQMYEEMGNALRMADNDSETAVTVITG